MTNDKDLQILRIFTFIFKILQTLVMFNSFFKDNKDLFFLVKDFFFNRNSPNVNMSMCHCQEIQQSLTSNRGVKYT